MSGYGSPRLQRPLYGVRIDTEGQLYMLAAAGTPTSTEHPGLRLVTVSHRTRFARVVSLMAPLTRATPRSWISLRTKRAAYICWRRSRPILARCSTSCGASIRMVSNCGRERFSGSPRAGPHRAARRARVPTGRCRQSLRGARVAAVWTCPRRPQPGESLWPRIPGADVGKLVIGADGALYFSQFRDVAGQQRRVVVRRGLADGRAHVVPTQIQLLDDLPGADDQGRIYVRLSDGFARMAADRSAQWRQRILGAVDAPGQQVVYACTRSKPVDQGGLEVQAWDTGGVADEPRATLRLEVPPDAWPTTGDVPTLVAIDQDRFYVYGGGTSLSPACASSTPQMAASRSARHMKTKTSNPSTPDFCRSSRASARHRRSSLTATATSTPHSPTPQLKILHGFADADR